MIQAQKNFGNELFYESRDYLRASIFVPMITANYVKGTLGYFQKENKK